MRKVLISCVIVFLILSVIPLCALTNTEPRSSDNIKKAQNDNSSVEKEKDETIRMAAQLCQEDFCDEGLKCALAIARNNRGFAETKNTTLRLEISDEFYGRLSKLYSESTTTIEYMGEIVYIPTSSMSSGFVKESSDYPYIKSVASPWDCIQKDFVYEKDYADGISMAGLNYLCENQRDFKDALRWYLPAFSIQ